MKTLNHLFAGILCLFVCATEGYTQDFADPVKYMSHISKANQDLSTKYLGYLSASSHGKNMKKIEKKRSDLINSVYETRVKIYDMPSYNGDKSLRDSAVSYLKIMYSVFNEDYSKLVNMEEIAEQSYDMMEAFLLAQEKAGDRLTEAHNAYASAYEKFAKANNITLIDTESEVEQKLETANKISEYYHQVYLVFFKCYKQEMYLLEALKTNNINALEQNKTALIQVCESGLAKLKEMKGYNSDRSVEAACKQVLLFLKDEAEKKVPVITEYMIGQETVKKLQTALEAKSASERTKQEVDSYNKAIAGFNKTVTAYNNTTQELNNKRSDIINQYNSSVEAFMNTHMPHSN